MTESTMAIELQRAQVYREDKLVLKNITLQFRHDEHVAVLGPNGSGKSTLIKVLSGDLHPVHRDHPAPVKLFGETSWDLFQLRNQLGMVTNELQETHLRPIPGEEVVLSGFFGSIGLHQHQQVTKAMRAKVESIMRFLDIRSLRRRLMTEMSSGESRRFLIARALVHDPKMLVLDEPFNSLDIHGRVTFSQVIRKLAQQGHSLILVTHALEEIVPEINRVVLIKQGRVFADGDKTATLTSQKISRLYDLPLTVNHQDQHYWVIPR